MQRKRLCRRSVLGLGCDFLLWTVTGAMTSLTGSLRYGRRQAKEGVIAVFYGKFYEIPIPKRPGKSNHAGMNFLASDDESCQSCWNQSREALYQQALFAPFQIPKLPSAE
jgi:hypothetical protein